MSLGIGISVYLGIVLKPRLCFWFHELWKRKIPELCQQEGASAYICIYAHAHIRTHMHTHQGFMQDFELWGENRMVAG